jgi:hypothetical protein
MAITTLDDLFDQEERALQIAHEQWLNDPVAQAAYRKQRELDSARAEREMANAEPAGDDPEEDEEEGDDE